MTMRRWRLLIFPVLLGLVVTLLDQNVHAHFSSLAFRQRTVYEKAVFFAHLDEAAGATTFADSSQYRGSGTCTTCPTAGSPSVIGKSVTFNGTSTQLTFGRPSQLMFDRNNAFSISVWEKMTTTVSMTPAFANAYGLGGSKGWSLFLCGASSYVNCPTHNLAFYMINTWTSNALNVYTSSANLNDGGWHHIVITYDGSSSATGVKIYIDGSSVTVNTYTNSLSASILHASSEATLGLIQADNRYYAGDIDEVAAWNYVLSPSEVQVLYRH